MRDLKILDDRLSDAQRWCSHIQKLDAFPFREQLCYYLDSLDVYEWNAFLPAEVERIVRKRKEQLAMLDADSFVAGETNGKILTFDPDSCIHDGLLQSESEGLFDVHGCPIPDFWIGFVDVADGRRLLSWIPAAFINRVELAMDVDAVECIRWI